MRKSIFFILLALLTTSGYGFNKTGSSAAQFLKIGVGARASALGESFVAMADDPTCLFWNPAGLVLTGRPEILGTHTEFFADLSHEFVGIVLPLGEFSAMGLSVIALNSGEMEVTTIAEPEGTGAYFSYGGIAVGITYAQFLTERFSTGVTVKYVQERAHNENAGAVAFDVGTLLDTEFLGVRIGMCMSNFGGGMKLAGADLITSSDVDPQLGGNPETDARLETGSWPLPLNFRVGIATELMGEDGICSSEAHRVVIALDGVYTSDNVEKGSMGMEYEFARTLALRVGYKLNYDEQTLSYGGGLRKEVGGIELKIDYALAKHGRLGDVHRLGLGLRF